MSDNVSQDDERASPQSPIISFSLQKSRGSHHLLTRARKSYLVVNLSALLTRPPFPRLYSLCLFPSLSHHIFAVFPISHDDRRRPGISKSPKNRNATTPNPILAPPTPSLQVMLTDPGAQAKNHQKSHFINPLNPAQPPKQSMVFPLPYRLIPCPQPSPPRTFGSGSGSGSGSGLPSS